MSDPVPLCSHGDDANACQLYHPVPIPPDAVRDARVAARRAADARKAGRALDAYFQAAEGAVSGATTVLPMLDAGEHFVEALGDYVLSRIHHNGHYGVSPEACPPWCGVGGPKCAITPHYDASAAAEVLAENYARSRARVVELEAQLAEQHKGHYGVPDADGYAPGCTVDESCMADVTLPHRPGCCLAQGDGCE